MHDAQAALSGAVRGGDEEGDGFVRLVPVHAVQVDVTLDSPAPTAQVAQHGALHAGTDERVGIAQIEPVVDVERRIERFGNHGDVVEFALTGLRSGLGRLENDALVVAQRYRAVDRGVKGGKVFGVAAWPLIHRADDCLRSPEARVLARFGLLRN